MNSRSISSSGVPTSCDQRRAGRLAGGLGRAGQLLGQVVQVQQAVVIDHHHALDHVAKLADVAGPVE